LVGTIRASITRFLQTRDELSFRNIRGRIWSLILIFPLSVIVGNLRYYDHSIALAGISSSQLMFSFLGLGWLILIFIPERFIVLSLRLAAIISVLLLIVLFFMPMGSGQAAFFIALKFFNGFSAACAFYLFCFVLNNIERLAGMAIIQLYYGFYYAAWNISLNFHAVSNMWGRIAISIVFLVVVFCVAGLCRERSGSVPIKNIDNDGKGSGVPFVIGLGVVHYMIMCMSNYIEWAESSVSSFAFGLGTLFSIALVIIVQLLRGRSALYIWIMFLTFTLFGLGALLYDSSATIISGSFAYGMGDSLGYIIICYMCAGAIKQSKSLRMFKLYCFVFFIQYFVISGIFSVYFNYFDEANRFLAFGVVLVLVTLCLLFMPFIQKRLFEADWTDGLYLRDMEEYSQPLAETEAINVKDHLDLTPREQELFTMLLNGTAPKEIGYILKISYGTVLYHQQNLYRKLQIHSIAELFARYKIKAKEENT